MLLQRMIYSTPAGRVPSNNERSLVLPRRSSPRDIRIQGWQINHLVHPATKHSGILVPHKHGTARVDRVARRGLGDAREWRGTWWGLAFAVGRVGRGQGGARFGFGGRGRFCAARVGHGDVGDDAHSVLAAFAQVAALVVVFLLFVENMYAGI